MRIFGLIIKSNKRYTEEIVRLISEHMEARSIAYAEGVKKGAELARHFNQTDRTNKGFIMDGRLQRQVEAILTEMEDGAYCVNCGCDVRAEFELTGKPHMCQREERC